MGNVLNFNVLYCPPGPQVYTNILMEEDGDRDDCKVFNSANAFESKLFVFSLTISMLYCLVVMKKL